MPWPGLLSVLCDFLLPTDGTDLSHFWCHVVLLTALTWSSSGFLSQAPIIRIESWHGPSAAQPRVPLGWAEQSLGLIVFFFSFSFQSVRLNSQTLKSMLASLKSVLLLSFQILLALGCLTDGCLALWTSCHCSTLFYYSYWSMHGLHFSALCAPSSKKSLFLPWAWFQKLLDVIARRSQAFPLRLWAPALREPRLLKQNAVTPQWLSHAFWKSESHSFYWQLFTRVKISLHQEKRAVFSWYQHAHELSVGHLLKESNIAFWHAFVSFWDTTLPLQQIKFLILFKSILKKFILFLKFWWEWL